MSERRNYYGHPAVKPPPFDRKVAYYMQIAGLGGAAQCIAAAASLKGGRRMRPVVRNGRYLALLSAAVGPLFLVADLKTPDRWYNMLRIFRRTSPMSIGSWILAGFGMFSGLAAIGQAARSRRPGFAGRIARSAELPAAALGAGMATYTASLLSATSNPLWAAAPRALAAQYGSSAIAGGAAALSLLERFSGRGGNARRLDHLALAATAVECAAADVARRTYRAEKLDGALEGGRAAAEDRLAVLLGQVVPLCCFGFNAVRREPSPLLSAIGAISLLAGGTLRKASMIEAGWEAAKDPDDYLRFTRPRAGRDRPDRGRKL